MPRAGKGFTQALRDRAAASAGKQKARGPGGLARFHYTPICWLEVCSHSSRCGSRLLRRGHVENQRTEDLGAGGIRILQTHEEVADGVLLFLRTVVAVSDESGADLVEGCEVLDGIPDVVSEVAIGADVFHGEAVGKNDAVGGKLLKNGLVVFLPGFAIVSALARLHLNDIIAGERK